MGASVVALWFVAYVVTNLDDLLLLTLFFAHPEFRLRNVVLAEYLGIATIFIGSLLVARGTAFLPEAWVGLLGLVPVVLGVRLLLRGGENLIVSATPGTATVDSGSATTADPAPAEAAGQGWVGVVPPAAFVPRDLAVVWLVTVANGGDNLAVYVPLFRTQEFQYLPIVAGVFVVSIGFWCVLGWYAGKRPVVERLLRRFSHLLLPYTLIVLGLYVLVTSGSPSLLVNLASHVYA